MYTLHYTIQNDQCDYTGRLRDENIFVYFSRIATVDGSLSGFYKESMKGKYGYVVSKQSLILTEPIYEDDEITLTTEIGHYSNVIFPRFYYIEKEGRRIGECRSIWTLIDLKRRRITSPKRAGLTLPDNPDLVKEEPETLFTQDDRQLVSTYTVPYSDIDTNRHLNNTHYLRIASNLIPVEAYENHFMDSISINYKKEILAHQTIELYLTHINDTYIIEELRSDSNKGFELIPPFEIVVSRNNLVIDLGTLTDEYEKEISIHTTATSKDGDKTILAGKEVTIVDTVKLDGLTKGTKYQLKGWQMLKEENAELIIDGKRVESDYTFTADSETMKVEVAFTFDATSLDGKQLVTFEELYDLSNPDEPKKVTEHKDIEDKGQTITFKEKPEEPEKPETPPTPEKPNRPSDSPKTGDSTNVMAFIVMLLASAGGLAGTYLYKRRKMKKS